jgi:hypothetical protein
LRKGIVLEVLPGDLDVFTAACACELDTLAGYLVIRDTEELITASTPDFHPARPPVKTHAEFLKPELETDPRPVIAGKTAP